MLHFATPPGKRRQFPCLWASAMVTSTITSLSLSVWHYGYYREHQLVLLSHVAPSLLHPALMRRQRLRHCARPWKDSVSLFTMPVLLSTVPSNHLPVCIRLCVELSEQKFANCFLYVEVVWWWSGLWSLQCRSSCGQSCVLWFATAGCQVWYMVLSWYHQFTVEWICSTQICRVVHSWPRIHINTFKRRKVSPCFELGNASEAGICLCM